MACPKSRWLAVLGCLACLPAAPPPKTAIRQIRVPVWADARADQPLTLADLHARLAGTDVRVVRLRGPQDDLMILTVLDMVGDLSYVEPAKDALVREIEKLPPATYVGLMRAQDGLRVMIDPTADREAATEAVRNLPVSGKAGFLDTVEMAARVGEGILSKTSVRVAILYVTDSEIENYREDYTNPVINSSDTHDLSRRFPEALIQEKFSKLTATMMSWQAPIFVVHLRYRGDRLGEAYQNGLKQIAELTGGASIFCRSSAEIPEAVHRMIGLISSQYSVTLAVPERKFKHVQVQLDAEDKRPLNYRTRFFLKTR